MRVVAETLQEFPEVLVHVGVVRDVVHELIVLLLVRQLAVPQQPRYLEKRCILSQLLDRIAAIPQNSLVAIDESDGAAAGGGVEEGWIVAYKTQIVGVVGLYFLQIRRPDSVLGDRNRVSLAGARVLYLERAAGRGGRGGGAGGGGGGGGGGPR